MVKYEFLFNFGCGKIIDALEMASTKGYVLIQIRRQAMEVRILLCVIFLELAPLYAQNVIENRVALDGLLNLQRVDENFESYPISDGGGSLAGGVLSSTNGEPVVSGITISGTYPDPPDGFWFQWNGNGYRGSTTKTVHTSYDLHLDFWNPTVAFGLDVKDFQTFRHVFVASVIVYGGDDSTILYSDNAININDPATGTFFGFQNPDGIGLVIFSTISGDPAESPLIDNLSFSTQPIPEPSTFAIALLGFSALAFRFRKM